MMPTPATTTVLIAGVSIAGLTPAYWLATYGFSVMVVERAPALRLGGQNIDINGSGRKVIRLPGVEDRIWAANTGELGLQFIGPQGEVAAEFPKDEAEDVYFDQVGQLNCAPVAGGPGGAGRRRRLLL